MDEKPLVPDDRETITPADKCILVIEDDPAFTGIVCGLIRAKGFKCLASGHGRQGIKLAGRFNPAGILLDLGLPDIDGIEVMEQLKASAATRHIPVHVLSARALDPECLHQGATGFFTKPVSKVQLEEALARIEQFGNEKARKLLVVEDDPNTRAVIGRLMADGQVLITNASSGAEALGQLDEQRFDCMILDLSLPDMEGEELLRRMSEKEAYSRPPVIIYSGKDLSEEEYEQLGAYTSSFVIKGDCSDKRLVDEAALFLHSVHKALPKEEQQALQRSSGNAENSLSGKTVLLADDDMRNTFALARSLRRHNLEVIIAQDGAKALMRLQEHPEVDIVLMDIMMPVMDGYETMRRIREQACYKELPIIAITAHAMAEDHTKCIEAGANDYLTKPVDLDRLLALLRVWLYR